MMSYPWRTTTLRRSTAEPSQKPTDGLHTLTVGLSTSIRFSTHASTPAATSNRRTRRPTWTAAAPTQESFTTATPPCASSQIVAGGGVVATGRLPTINTSSDPEPLRLRAVSFYRRTRQGREERRALH